MNYLNNKYKHIPWQKAHFYNYPYEINYPLNTSMNNNLTSSTEVLQQPNTLTPFNTIINIPISTAKSMEGKYFGGTAIDINFGEASNGWSRIFNPPNSGVNIYVNTWRVSDIFSTPYRVQIWFNATPPGIIQESPYTMPLNSAIRPLPQPKGKIQFGVGTKGFPSGGSFVFGTSRIAGDTIEEEVQGRYIFPPGGSFTVYLSNPQNPTIAASGRVVFGWWEEPI